MKVQNTLQETFLIIQTLRTVHPPCATTPSLILGGQHRSARRPEVATRTGCGLPSHVDACLGMQRASNGCPVAL